MRMITKLLTTTLLGSVTFWACGVERAPDRTSQASSHIYQMEDGPGSGSDPTDPDPDPETCSATGDVTPAQLAEAKAALKKYLNGCTGQAAIDKVLAEFDKNPKDGQLNGDEMLKFIKKMGLGGMLFAKQWCNGVMAKIDTDKDGQATQAELQKFLDDIGLGGPDQCVAPTEDSPTVPTEPTYPTEDSPGVPGAP